MTSAKFPPIPVFTNVLLSRCCTEGAQGFNVGGPTMLNPSRENRCLYVPADAHVVTRATVTSRSWSKRDRYVIAVGRWSTLQPRLNYRSIAAGLGSCGIGSGGIYSARDTRKIIPKCCRLCRLLSPCRSTYRGGVAKSINNTPRGIS
jgi:hypothetical protein